MLYKLTKTLNTFDGLQPVGFKDFSDFGNLERDLENLLAENILEVLFGEAPLMPVFQERPMQKEADIYALDKSGDLIIFELKRSSAGVDAVIQALSYAQDAGQWSYTELQDKYHQYSNGESELVSAHQDAFNLEVPLDSREINKQQKLIIIGSAADESLISAVDYWRKQSISIEFLPYRVYELSGKHYFEFFASPYDKHQNPAHRKGVLFDTCGNYGEDALWYMMENECVAAFGDAQRFVNLVYPNDIVFFSHVRTGIVAAATVLQGPVQSPEPGTSYRNVEFLTPVPLQGEELNAMPFSTVSEITGKRFFWARTIKVPYLTAEEATNLVEHLQQYLEN